MFKSLLVNTQNSAPAPARIPGDGDWPCSVPKWMAANFANYANFSEPGWPLPKTDDIARAEMFIWWQEYHRQARIKRPKG